MAHPTLFRVPALVGLLSLSMAPGCGDDEAGGAGFTSADEGIGEDGFGETGTMNGDGAPSEGDSGDGDGDSAPGDSGDGDGDAEPGGGSGDGDSDSGANGDSGGDGNGDGDGDGDDPGGGDPGDDDGPACQEFENDLALVPPSVMFLLDRSGSMMEEDFDPDDPDKTRWHALYEAVEAVVAGDADSAIAFGAKTFATKGAGECGVTPEPDVPIALDNAEALLDKIPGPNANVTGGTPTNLAVEVTMDIMKEHQTQGDKFIFLITDGRIGCVDDDEEEEATAAAAAVLADGVDNHGITTYVVGIAPSMNGPLLSQLEDLAIAGGAPKPGNEKFYRADDAETLAEVLSQVVEDSYGNSCLLDLDEPPGFPDYTKVIIGMTAYGLVADCDTEDGFIYTSPEMTQIRMCGLGCEALSEFKAAKVQFFCQPG